MIEPTNIVLAKKMLKRESLKICLHIFHDRAVDFALVQMLLRRALQKQVVMLGHFVSYTLRFPNKNTQVSFCLETLAVFHVKHAITRVAKIYLYIFMTEYEHVGL